MNEAERQAELARRRLEEGHVLRASGHSSAAWDVLDEAERVGVDPYRVGELRLQLYRWGSEEWLPKARAYAATIRDDAKRADFYRGLAESARNGSSWFLAQVERGEVIGVDLDVSRAAWAGWIAKIESMTRPPLS
jgi:hypothetical protein